MTAPAVAGPTVPAHPAGEHPHRYASAPMRYRFGDHTLDTDTLQLLAGTTEIDLEPQVFAVLAHLVAHRDRVVPKEELLDEVWGSRFVSESVLTTRIKQVRRAVGDSGRTQHVVRTSHGRGYRFVAPVDELDGPVPAPAGATAPPEAAPVQPAATPAPGSGAVPPTSVPTAAPAARPVTPAPPTTRWADSGGASIAYQTFGEGPDLVLVSGFATNVDAQWEHPVIAEQLTRLGRFARVTVLDKRGVGLSDRLPHDSVPPLETRADDLAAVLDAAGIERATLLGSSEGGSLSAVFAATHPERVERLVLHNTWVDGGALATGPLLDHVLEHWGTGRIYAALGRSLARHPGSRELLARYERQSATPRTARHLAELIGQIDISGVLPAITAPTLVLHRARDRIAPLSQGEALAAAIPGARLVVLDGGEHHLFAGDTTQPLAAIEELMTGTPPDDATGERILATVLLVDLVDSTRAAQALGDAAWTAQLDRFHVAARAEVERQRGALVNTTGDGLIATFDGPGRAVRAATAIREAVAGLGLSARAGLHTAEIQCRGTDIAGIGVHIAGRVAALAEPGEVWVSRTVTDLVAGTGLRFEPRGEHALKGIDTPWALYAAAI
jgi:pimeloyl-ACP methyl ester carboxylesterase/DNA-binding winged helix-turn-helix (wHTH) protein